jgi:outer membrane receptor protein involved in Fe transport
MPIRIRACLICGASLAVLAAVPSIAAETAADMASTFVESVTVTAQKRVQTQVEVPMALTAYSGKFLEKIDAQELDKLSLYVPGFEVQNQSPNNPGLVLRGLTLDSGDATLEPRVSVFEDDVSISATRGTYIELFDIERVEVVRGPQTTLFGRAALMGGVNVIQNKADLSGRHFAATVEAGDHGYVMAEGMANLPLSDTVAVRVAGRYKMRDGTVDNLGYGDAFNSIDTAAIRLATTWKPNEDFSADIIFNFEADHPSGTSFKSGTFAPIDVATGTIVGDLDPNSGATLSSAPGFEKNKPLGLDRYVWDGKAILGYKVSPAVKLTSVTAYRRFDSEEVFDPDGSAQPILVAAEDARSDQFSQELRVNYDDGGRINAFAGVDYFYSNISARVPLQFDERMALALLAGQGALLQNYPSALFDTPTYIGGYAPAMVQGLAQALYYKNFSTVYAMPTATAQGIAANLKPNHWEQATSYGKTKSFDFYADVTVKVIDDFELEGGVRYTHDDKTSSYAGTSADRSVLGGLIGALGLPAAQRDAILGGLATPGAGSITAIPTGLLPNFALFYQPSANNGDKISRSFNDDGLSWRFTARYALEADTSLYATYARGRRPKVLDALSPSLPYASPVFTPVDAETVDSYEIGAKTVQLDGKLHADVALYTYQYTNFQTSVLANNTPTTTNAGKANAWGIETSLDWALADWADVFGTYAYNRARFGGTSIYKGNKFRLNPDHKLSLGLALHQSLLGGVFTLLPTFTWQSKIFFDDDNDIPALQTTHLLPDLKQDELQKAYGLFNLRLTYAPEDQPWTFSVFATNLFEKKYIKDAGNTGDNLGIPTFIAGEPRFVGISVAFKTR